MDERTTPDPVEAQASLDQVEESRRAAVKAGRRPLGIDLGMAAVVGTGVGLGLAGQLAQVHFLVRPHEQQGQHLAPVLVGEKQVGSACCRFHKGNVRCLFRNTCIVRQETQSRQA